MRVLPSCMPRQVTTPLAEVIMDHKVGDVCTVRRVEEPYDVKILEIK